MYLRRLALLPAVLAIVLAGCVTDDESVTPSSNPNAGFKPRYVPLGGIVPFPNDIFFSGSTDGTLNIPVADESDFGDPLVAMNALDGYSTFAPITAHFTDAIDATTLSAATVRVLDITNPLAPVPLTFGTDFTAGVSPAVDGQNVLQITPLRPLNAKSRYAVYLLAGIESTTGEAAVADVTFQQIKDAIAAGATLPNATLEAVKQAVAPLMQLATALGINADDVLVTWSFATQSTTDVLDAVEDDATAQTALITPASIGTTANLNPQLSGKADVYVGVIELPYYLDRNAPLTGFWRGADGSFLTRFNPTPVPTGTIRVPLLLTVPNANSATGGAIAGVTIFQHGITQNRTNALAVADALADAGRAVIAIDLPLHGITDTASPLYASASNPLYLLSGVTEATFNLDLVNNTTGAPGADGVIDTSGKHFINLSSLLTSRDNLRQAVANLIHLAKTIPTLDYNGAAAGGSLAGLPISFVGHSLGAITGTTFLGVNSDVGPATLGMPGGGIARLLRDSPTFEPVISAGLAANGVVEGTQLYEDFFRNAQTVIDSGDPLNFADEAASDHPIHMIEVVGGGGSLPDQVVPNSATERLVSAMGLASISTTTISGSGVRGVVRFTAGDHGSLLSPTASLAATVEMQTQMANFIGSGGTALVITNTGVIQ
ncbi:MAG TPA: lipase [Gammaproteobacteria bacterium]|nr:lipase [Gammaproteobacteria bacterium]